MRKQTKFSGLILMLFLMVIAVIAAAPTAFAKSQEAEKSGSSKSTVSAQMTAPVSTYGDISEVTVTADGSAYEITIHVDTDGNTSLFKYSIDGGANWETGNNTFKVTQDGIYTVQVISDAGETLTYTSDIAITGMDAGSPAYTRISGVEVSPDSPSKTKTVAINLDTDQENTPSFQYSINNGIDWQSDKTFTIDENGSYKAAVKITASHVIHYYPPVVVSKVDNTPPTITSVSCDDSTWSQSKDITVSAADDMALADSPYRIDGSAWQESPTFTVTQNGRHEITVKDLAGNMEQTSITIDKIDTLPPECGTAAVDPAAFAQSKKVTITADDTPATADSGESGVVSYRVDGGEWLAYGTPYQVTEVGIYPYQVKDRAGNLSPAGSFRVDKIDTTSPVISQVTVEKKSGTSEPKTVKNGDSITVKFLAVDPASPAAPDGFSTSSGVDNRTVKVTINEETFLASGPDADGRYSCTKTVGSDFKGDENGRIKIAIHCTDQTGNAAKPYEKTTGIVYYAPIRLHELAMISDNENEEKSVAKDGDKVKVTFSTTHPVRISEGKIAGQKADFSSSDGMNWTAVRTVKNGLIADYTYVPLTFLTSDTAGNQPIVSEQDDTTTPKIRYHAPITLKDIVIETNNRKDKTKYAKDGDTVSVTFTSNHKVSLSHVMIAKKTPTITRTAGENGTAVRWKLTYKLKNGDLDDLSKVGFTAAANDAAGNTPVKIQQKTKGVKNKITYYSPITSTTKIASNYINQDYLKNGDTITVTGKSNHSVEIIGANIAGRKTDHSVYKNTQTITYTMPKKEARIKEGVIPFDYELEDPAGNRLYIDKTNDPNQSQVTYDRTAPTVAVSPDNYAFTKEKITYTFTYEDTNLDGKDTAILVTGGAGRESKGKSISKTKYERSITLSTDGNYNLKGEVIDLAGNKCEKAAETRVTVDKIKPIINTEKVDLYTPEVFKGGFTLNQCFQFVDDNLKGIECVVTNKNGTYDWDGALPFTVDGKQSVTMIATDMAGNTSEPVNYDFYIDSTKPKAMIKDSNTGEVLEPDKETAFTEKADLAIRLESLNIQGITAPDQLKTLQLYNDQDQMVADLLNDQKPKEGTYLQKISELGTYSLKLQAVDAVGNNTGLLTYPILIKEKTMVQKFFENTPLVTITFIVLAAMITALILLIKKRKRDKGEKEEQKERLRNLLDQ